jgi:hypothetical protein
MRKFLAAFMMLVLLAGPALALAGPASASALPGAVSAASAKAAERASIPAKKRVCWRKALFEKRDGKTEPARTASCGSDFKHPCVHVVAFSVQEPHAYRLPPVRRLSGSDGSGLLRPPIA